MPGPISIETHNKIIELHGRGFGPTATARQLNISVKCARTWINRYTNTGRVEPAPIPGRPCVTTAEDDGRIIAVSRQHTLWPARKIRWVERMRVSIQTVWRRMRVRLKPRCTRRKDRQLEKQSVRSKRVVWAEQQAEELSGWVERIVYVDESQFDSCTNFRTRVWVPRDQVGQLNVQSITRSGRFSIHVFGAICDDYTLPLIILPRPFDAVAFTDLLQEFYLPVLQEKFPRTQFKFILDNAPVHHSKITQEWLEEVPELQKAFLFLPPYSNDLNPIEHVWARMKKQIRDIAFTNKDQLSAAVINQWDALPQEYIHSLTHSMQRRMRAVIVAQGGPTRY